MVSGLVTSPCDQLRIFSGEARLIRMASKSAITFAISKGLERNKGILRFLLSASTQYPVLSTQYLDYVFRRIRELLFHETFSSKLCSALPVRTQHPAVFDSH